MTPGAPDSVESEVLSRHEAARGASGAKPRPTWTTVDGNEAVASIAHRASEVIAIYPITPSSTMGELADEWSAQGRRNLWGAVPEVVEMQSEGGAIGAVHGALQAGALATTFTSSQGLLLMIPNLYKIAGELTPFAFHVAARTVATHALSIFGDHSDVMACRQTGVAMLASGSVQEAHDFAAIAHAATLATRLPFLHFFDGFRTSHEVSKIQTISDEELQELIDRRRIAAHRDRALSPDRPVVRGTAQNPDVFFQAREAANPYYLHAPGAVRGLFGRFAELTGRSYRLFDYVGHPAAERVIVMMGSGAETAHETVEWLVARGERVGLVKVRLYRPFSAADFLAALPRSVHAIAVLDRTKEPGATGEPLYLDIVDALVEAQQTADPRFNAALPAIIGGRYGLSSKEFTPAQVKAVFDELARPRPLRHFTIGIVDDITGLSLTTDPAFDIEPPDVQRAIFYGLGADGTVGANKNSIKIIGDDTESFVQGYFVYDSKKSGAVTISHLRFGPRPIRSSYLVSRAQFVACHQPELLERYDVLEHVAPGGVFLLNTSVPADQFWDSLSHEAQRQITDKTVTVYVVDAHRLAREAGLGSRINTIMQTCYFLISGVLPRAQAIARIKESIQKTYGKRGAEVVKKNIAVITQVVTSCFRVDIPDEATATRGLPAVVPNEAPDFVKRVTAMMLAGRGDLLPVSAFPVDGTWPVGTSQWEKRNIASEIPVWDPPICIQCNKCALVCPHAAIRVKVYDAGALEGGPPTFKFMDYTGKEFGQPMKYTIQVAPEDCTGCNVCVMVCPAHDKSHPEQPTHKALEMQPQRPLRDSEHVNYQFFLGLPNPDRRRVKLDNKGTQLLQPLFEYSGACAGCGETPYVKLLTQLFGDRALVANATGCSSIFGGNLPTTPYTCNPEGRGPAWANSLFEDNAEFGFGFRLAVDRHAADARALVDGMRSTIGAALAGDLLAADQHDESGIAAQRQRVTDLRTRLAGVDTDDARRLGRIADYLVRKSVWVVGGDGWAYDIGYGGLDHVLASTRDVNILVLDTEVYSNTGGQQSKATPLAAAARFAAAGKSQPKKDLGLMAMSYGHVYVAQVALGAKDAQTVKAFLEAESYPGPSLIIAYSPCIAHGYDLAHSLDQEKAAVESGYWPLYRFDPRKASNGGALTLDSSRPRGDLMTFLEKEARFRIVERADPERFKRLAEEAAQQIRRRYELYETLAGRVQTHA